MRLKSLLVALTLGAVPALVPTFALAQSCGKSPVAISCPEGHAWDAGSMLCLPPST